MDNLTERFKDCFVGWAVAILLVVLIGGPFLYFWNQPPLPKVAGSIEQLEGPFELVSKTRLHHQSYVRIWRDKYTGTHWIEFSGRLYERGEKQ